MPVSPNQNTPALSIELTGSQPTYLPGDTLSGLVRRAIPNEKNFDASLVTIKFFGRAKTKYVIRRSNRRSTYRGRAVLFELQQSPQKTTQSQTDDDIWPFVFQIPDAPHPGIAVRSDEFKTNPMFLATTGLIDEGQSEVTQHLLPPTMYHSNFSGLSGNTVEAYVEYVLIATLGSTQASLPIFVRQRTVDSPIVHHDLKSRPFSQMIKTPKLLTEHIDSDLTVRQKTKMIFKPSKTPRYSYTIRVEYPTIIQLENPNCLPFNIYLVPDFNPENTTIPPDVDFAPPVQVTDISVRLKCNLSIRCPGTVWDDESTRSSSIDMCAAPILPSATIPVVDPQKFERSNQINPKVWHSWLNDNILLPPNDFVRPYHLGEYLQIFLGTNWSSYRGSRTRLQDEVYPTFTTYNIAVNYRLKWKIKTQCADKQETIEHEEPVTVLPPSEVQERMRNGQISNMNGPSDGKGYDMKTS